MTDEKQNDVYADRPDNAAPIGDGVSAEPMTPAATEGAVSTDPAAAPDAADDAARADDASRDHDASVALDEPTHRDYDGAGSASTTGVPPQYGVGPLSIREMALVGVWALAFIFSFFPVYGRFGSGSSVWAAGIDWVLTIGVPTVAVFLIVLRRFSPQGIRRVGSLGIDQFASVAFSVSATVWLGIVWSSFVALAQTRVFVASWVVWVELILMLAGVVLTVVAPHLPVLGEDFRHRPESPAHRLARAVRPVEPRPLIARPASVTATSAPAAQGPAGYAAPTQAYGAPAHVDGASPGAGSWEATAADAAEPFDANATTVIDQQPTQQAFWALAPEERDVLDETGAPLFRIGPTAWALVIEDRGEVFVVRHEDGRVGYLHETRDVTRG